MVAFARRCGGTSNSALKLGLIACSLVRRLRSIALQHLFVDGYFSLRTLNLPSRAFPELFELVDVAARKGVETRLRFAV